MVEHFVRKVQSEFEMNLVDELTNFPGVQVKQMEDTIFISQRKYVKRIMKKVGLENAGHKRTSVATHDSGVDVDQSLHKSMIGSQLYLTTSRPEIAFVVGVCARYRP